MNTNPTDATIQASHVAVNTAIDILVSAAHAAYSRGQYEDAESLAYEALPLMRTFGRQAEHTRWAEVESYLADATERQLA